MAIRKTTEETLIVDGARDAWLATCAESLTKQRFTMIKVHEALHQIDANYKKLTVWGTLQITLLPSGVAATEIKLRADANVDNVFALFSSPGRKIIAQFKAGL